ncbi:MAG: ATP-binding cassette domain-containing protein [Acidobacteria bacterium]|nr:ATP-binding cassette domain-containing protein [Acidobacteriota bacterium]
MTALIEFQDVRFRYGDEEVLRGVSFALQAGKVLAVLGPSGAGKSSIVRVALGLSAPTTGTIRLMGEIASQDGRVLIAPEERGLGVVFQDLALWPHLTVECNLAFALNAQRVSREERRERIHAALSRVGLLEKARRYPGELSGGERQRVAIMRALVTLPRAVLLDEPLSNLDIALKQELLHLFRELLVEQHTAALYVTHDPREAARLAERLVVLEEGRVVQQGTFSDLRSRPATRFVEHVVEDLGTLGGSA